MRPKFLIPFIVIGIGVWLFLWNIIDFMTQALDYGIIEWSILQNGWLSILVGLAIIYIGYKLFRIKVF